jgi:outer membrane biosynthesis protein TonB
MTPPSLARSKKKKKKKTKKIKKKKKKGKEKKNKKRKQKEKKRRVPRRAISAGHRIQEHNPHAINGLVKVKKASFPPSSTTPCVLAHTGSRARSNGFARVASVQS